MSGKIQRALISDLLGVDGAIPLQPRGRLASLLSSVIGYIATSFAPRVAITGDGLRWNTGPVRIASRLGFSDLLAELAYGKPVAWVPRHQGAGLIDDLQFGEGSSLLSFINGNTCLTVSGIRAGQRVLAHVGRGSQGRVVIDRHATGLSEAREALQASNLIQMLASPLDRFTKREVAVFVQTFLDGSGISVVGDDDFNQALDKLADIAHRIHVATVNRHDMAEVSYLAKMRADLGRIGDPDLATIASSVINETERWLLERKPPAVRVHGDFTPGNVLINDDGNVSAIIDWEWTRANGCAGFDIFHAGVVAGGSDFSAIACSLIAGTGPPELSAFLERNLPQVEMRMSDVPALAKLYWLDLLFKGGVWTTPASEQWMSDVAAPMAAIMDRR